MKIALTGAGHFVGTRLIESFHLGGGPTLAAIVAHPSELTAAARFSIDLRVADFLDPDSLARSFTGCSALVHVAPLVNADAKRIATALCRAASRTAVKRVVLVSSVDVHGLNPRAETDERSALQTRHEIESVNTLVTAEKQVVAECRQLGLAAYVLRAGFLYGPRTPIVAALASAMQQERAFLPSPDDGITNCVYLDNLITAIRLALKTKAASGSAFLITDAETITWREFFDAIATELRAALAPGPSGSTPPDIHVAIPGLPADFTSRLRCTWSAPSAIAAKELAYQPTVSFAEGIRRSCAWWRFAQGEFSTAA